MNRRMPDGTYGGAGGSAVNHRPYPNPDKPKPNRKKDLNVEKENIIDMGIEKDATNRTISRQDRRNHCLL